MNISFAELDALVRALLHTLWQGGLILALLSALLRFIPVSQARVRYVFSLLALSGILIGGIVTWGWMDVSSRRASRLPVTLPSSAVPAASVPPSEMQALQALPMDEAETVKQAPPDASVSHRWVPWASAFWACGVLIFLIRGVTAVVGAGRLCQRAREVTSAEVLSLAEDVRGSLGFKKPVRLLTKEGIHTPAVIGIFRPVVLLPVFLLTGLPPEYLRAVMAHEFAHISRWDYMANLWQMTVEALLFFNPFVWWISRHVRLEREACCDLAASLHCQSPTTYMQAVLACTEHTQRSSYDGSSGELPAVALAMGGSNGSGSEQLLIRAKRLLSPRHRDSIRIPWLTLTGMFVATGLILFAMGKGAVLAAEVLTPKQRIERIDQLKKENTIAPIEGKQITVSGTVVTENGKPLSDRAQICINSRRGTSDSSHSTNLRRDGAFSITMPSGVIYVGAVDQGQAPVFQGPLRGDRDLTDLHLVLPKGFAALVHITDPHGHALEGVRIEGRYQGPPQMNAFTITTDAKGEAHLEGVSSEELTLETVKSGFQSARLERISLKAGQPLEWILDPADPFKGRVVSEETNAPIPNAKVEILHVDGPNGSTSYSPGNEDNPVRTNAQGEFTLTTLRDDAAYWLHIQADGFRPTASQRLTVRESPVEIKLGAPLHIKGKVVFPKDSAPLGKVNIQCEQFIHLANHSQGVGQRIDAKVKDGVAEFAFSNLYLDRTSTEIIVKGTHTKVPDFHQSLDDLVIDLTEKPVAVAKDIPKRWVAIRFDVPKDAPAPEGTLRVRYLEKGTGPGVQRSGTQGDFRVENGEVWLEVPVPNELTFEPEGLIGYALRNYYGVQRVPDGATPAEIRIPVTPAGAIYGEIVESDGSPARSAMISVVAGEELKNGNLFSLGVKDYARGMGDTQSQFIATPLPLGGSYAVVAYRGPTYVLGPSLHVDEKTPIQKARIIIPDGTTLRGLVTDENGNPVAFMRLGFTYAMYPNQRFSGQDAQTDRDGRFTIPHVNFAVRGGYLLQFEPRANYVPVSVKVDPQNLDINVRLAKGQVIVGTAVDASTGKPLSGMEVYATQVSHSPVPPPDSAFPTWFNAEAATDEQGRFRFSNLPEGAALQIGTRNANLADSSRPVTAKAGQSEPVVLKLKPVTGR